MSKSGLKYIVFVAVLVSIIFCCTDSYSQRASKTERRAERLFLYGDYDKSMRLYERALSRLPVGSISYYRLELRLANQYFILHNRPQTISHYKSVYMNADTLFTTGDIYRFADALRRSGLDLYAELVIRHYAFTGTYFLDKEYIANSLNSISNREYYIEGMPSDYKISPYNTNFELSNYWIGDYQSQLVFAQSSSEDIVNDSKVTYCDSYLKEFSSDYLVKDVAFEKIPQQLQQGPMTYNSDKKMLVATDVSLRGSTQIVIGSTETQRVGSNLIYSLYSTKHEAWTLFKPLFDSDELCSYAHPTFVNSGNALIFASDRKGGYGGMDLYISYWDGVKEEWSEPQNLGSDVNSKFDELYPRIYDNKLLFASNGYNGFGGFDNYHILWENDAPLTGTLYHYPPPINSIYNDFGMHFNAGTGFFISDRQDSGRDNIFIILETPTSLARKESIGVVSESYAMQTDVGFMEYLIHDVVPERRVLNSNSRFELERAAITNKDIVVYFDFDSYKLTDNTHKLLEEFRFNYSNKKIENISIVGYTDFVGTIEYNKKLSLERAESIADYMEQQLPNIPIDYEGKGIVEITKSDEIFIDKTIKSLTPEQSNFTSIHIEQPTKIRYHPDHRKTIIDMFKPYRRVEIEIQIKQ